MSSLARLSLARVDGNRHVPHVPSNDERVQAFRRYQPVQFANAVFGLSKAERYAQEQCADARAFDFEENYRDAF
jgi:hypothetical protein